MLLDTGVCDANTANIFPIEMRPLHIVCASGFGLFAQMLLDYNADPSIVDEQGRKPIEKLHSYYNNAVQLQLMNAGVQAQ